MSKLILKLLFSKYSEYAFICLICSIFFIYYGIYALLGNKVIIKTQGMVYLSTATSITNIIIGIIIIIFVLKEKKNKNR